MKRPRKPTTKELRQLVLNLARRVGNSLKSVRKDLEDDCDIAVFDRPTSDNPLAQTMVVVRDGSILEAFGWDTDDQIYPLESDWDVYLYTGRIYEVPLDGEE
jgi:hypothetical protein